MLVLCPICFISGREGDHAKAIGHIVHNAKNTKQKTNAHLHSSLFQLGLCLGRLQPRPHKRENVTLWRIKPSSVGTWPVKLELEQIQTNTKNARNDKKKQRSPIV